jgi:hypothetical protein
LRLLFFNRVGFENLQFRDRFAALRFEIMVKYDGTQKEVESLKVMQLIPSIQFDSSGRLMTHPALEKEHQLPVGGATFAKNIAVENITVGAYFKKRFEQRAITLSSVPPAPPEDPTDELARSTHNLTRTALAQGYSHFDKYLKHRAYLSNLQDEIIAANQDAQTHMQRKMLETRISQAPKPVVDDLYSVENLRKLEPEKLTARLQISSTLLQGTRTIQLEIPAKFAGPDAEQQFLNYLKRYILANVELAQKDVRLWLYGIKLPGSDSFVDFANFQLLVMTLQQQKGFAEIELKLPLEPRFRSERQHNVHQLFCYRAELKAQFPAVLEEMMCVSFATLAILWNFAVVFVYKQPDECVTMLAWVFLLCWLVPEVVITAGKMCDPNARRRGFFIQPCDGMCSAITECVQTGCEPALHTYHDKAWEKLLRALFNIVIITAKIYCLYSIDPNDTYDSNIMWRIPKLLKTDVWADWVMYVSIIADVSRGAYEVSATVMGMTCDIDLLMRVDGTALVDEVDAASAAARGSLNVGAIARAQMQQSDLMCLASPYQVKADFGLVFVLYFADLVSHGIVLGLVAAAFGQGVLLVCVIVYILRVPTWLYARASDHSGETRDGIADQADIGCKFVTDLGKVVSELLQMTLLNYIQRGKEKQLEELRGHARRERLAVEQVTWRWDTNLEIAWSTVELVGMLFLAMASTTNVYYPQVDAKLIMLFVIVASMRFGFLWKKCSNAVRDLHTEPWDQLMQIRPRPSKSLVESTGSYGGEYSPRKMQLSFSDGPVWDVSGSAGGGKSGRRLEYVNRGRTVVARSLGYEWKVATAGDCSAQDEPRWVMRLDHYSDCCIAFGVASSAIKSAPNALLQHPANAGAGCPFQCGVTFSRDSGWSFYRTGIGGGRSASANTELPLAGQPLHAGDEVEVAVVAVGGVLHLVFKLNGTQICRQSVIEGGGNVDELGRVCLTHQLCGEDTATSLTIAASRSGSMGGDIGGVNSGASGGMGAMTSPRGPSPRLAFGGMDAGMSSQYGRPREGNHGNHGNQGKINLSPHRQRTPIGVDSISGHLDVSGAAMVID